MENKEIEQYIIDLMHAQCQIKVYHWQTKLYSKHKALDELVGTISTIMDEFAEAAMGKYGRVDYSGVSYTFENMTDAGVNTYIDGCIENCKKVQSAFDESDTDLMNLRDEILATLNKTKYLLTLK